ncbi:MULTISPECIES: cytidine deaminase [unclassified Fusibacter]|uniref:cytidine deaminase n=1 Tax=unclassified Fusibacter TaxID=2624464 RepID=UPI001010A707|nr:MULTISPECIES: cytidine deaminase [unclassified Fusibacter]MCK8058109.1 cytidine deaminase [Fusibacter sp. A2]NPE20691.1 cytidine deaminase [Fusibacter sp. A1]RXV62897.1 cytidine deaminase [Fusibacter sp. A1]
MEYRKLLDMAIETTKLAYAPYSKVQVGAALLGKSGKVYTGVNVENVSFGATNCAERTAIFKAVSEGELEFTAIAVASSLDHPITPCGICRQVIAEFGSNIEIILGDEKDYTVHKVTELLPLGFFKEELLD